MDMNETKAFLIFRSTLKEKYSEGITAKLFETELSREKKSFDFIKKIISNVNCNKIYFQNHSSIESGLTQTPIVTTNPVLPRCLGSSSTNPNVLSSNDCTPISSLISSPVSPFRFRFLPSTTVFAKGLGSSTW